MDYSLVNKETVQDYVNKFVSYKQAKVMFI